MTWSVVISGDTVQVRRELYGGGRRPAGPDRRAGRRQRLLTTQDRLVQGAEFGAGVGAEVGGEPLPEHGVPVDGFGAAATRVERPHEEVLKWPHQRVLSHEIVQNGNRRGRVFEPKRR